jgi:hypothetical protein
VPDWAVKIAKDAKIATGGSLATLASLALFTTGERENIAILLAGATGSHPS